MDRGSGMTPFIQTSLMWVVGDANIAISWASKMLWQTLCNSGSTRGTTSLPINLSWHGGGAGVRSTVKCLKPHQWIFTYVTTNISAAHSRLLLCWSCMSCMACHCCCCCSCHELQQVVCLGPWSGSQGPVGLLLQGWTLFQGWVGNLFAILWLKRLVTQQSLEWSKIGRFQGHHESIGWPMPWHPMYEYQNRILRPVDLTIRGITSTVVCGGVGGEGKIFRLGCH